MNIERYLGADYPTKDALLAATAFNAHMKFGHRAYIVHDDLTPVNLPESARTRGAAPHDISRFVTDVKPTWNASSTTMGTVEFTFEEFPGFESVNLIRDLLLLTFVYYDSRANVIREVKLGYYSFLIPKRQYDDAQRIWTVQGQDLTSRLARKGFLNTFTLPAGLDVTVSMAAMVQMDRFPPSRGGRKPSGVPWPNTAQANQPINQPGSNNYAPASNGVHVSTVADLIDDGAYWSTPATGPYGALLYNSLTDPLVDPTTFAPIDPWTHEPMPHAPVQNDWTGPGVFVAGYLNLWYITVGGFFVYAANPLLTPKPGGEGVAIDPFKMQPIPAGTSYKYPVGVGSNPIQVWGNWDLPLNTWPYDYDKSGKYYDTATVSGTSGTTSPSQTPTTISELTVGIGISVASRFATALGPLNMLSNSPVKVVNPPICAPDPSNLSHQWCQAPAGAAGLMDWTTIELDVSNLTTRADEWFANVYFQGGPNASGALTAEVHTWIRHEDGTTTDCGSNDGVIDFIDLQGQAEGLGPVATFPILMPALTAKAGETLCIQVALSGTLTTAPYGIGSNEGGFQLDHIQFDLPPGSTQALLAPPVVQPVPPTSSSTFIVWPDTNNPALTPAGCETIGPNLPASRVLVTPRDAVFPSPYRLATTLGFVAALNQLASTINYHNVMFDSEGNFVCRPSIFSTDDAPEPVLNIDSEKVETRIVWPSPTSDLLDQSTIANIISARSEPNQNIPPLKSVAWNDSPDSYISIENAGDTILRTLRADTILDQSVLDEYAKVELDWSAIGQQSIVADMWPIPWLELFDPITFRYVSPDGSVVVNTDPKNPFVVTQIALDISAKKMNVQMARWVPL